MKTQANNHHTRIIVLLGLIICSLVYAVATFWPSTTPTVTLGKYALENRDLTVGETHAYRPWFENGSWQGDIIQYIIGTNGSRTTDADVGSNPPTATGTNWMARATFRDKGADDPSGSYWKNRKIISFVNDTQVPFLWDELTPSQKKALDLATLNDPNGDGDTSDAIDPTVSLDAGGYISVRRSTTFAETAAWRATKPMATCASATACWETSPIPRSILARPRNFSGHLRASLNSMMLTITVPASLLPPPMTACCISLPKLMAPSSLPMYPPWL